MPGRVGHVVLWTMCKDPVSSRGYWRKDPPNPSQARSLDQMSDLRALGAVAMLLQKQHEKIHQDPPWNRSPAIASRDLRVQGGGGHVATRATCKDPCLTSMATLFSLDADWREKIERISIDGETRTQ